MSPVERLERYSFDEAKHIHMLDGKPLMGTTTVLGIINKPFLVQWAADLAAISALSSGEHFPDLLAEYEEVKKIEGSYARAKAMKQLDSAYPAFKVARGAHRLKKEKAGDWGTIVHKAIEVWIASRVEPVEVDIKGTMEKILPEHHVAIQNFINWAIEKDVQFFESEKGIYSEIWWVGGIVDFVCKIDGKLFVGDLKTSGDIYESYWLQTAAYAKMMVELGVHEHFDGMVIVNCRKDGTVKVEERKDIAGNIKAFEAALTLHKRFQED